jgi:2-polyprenyl-3-methyl-5-hydroxy-6-metoxy-1,4-benzoquinol methylase
VKKAKEISANNGCVPCSDAKSWVQSLWDTASLRWTGRAGQDRNYRSRVIHPFISAYVRDHVSPESQRILDLGCGDGALLDYERLPGSDGKGIRCLGVDRSETLMESVRNNHLADNVSFLKMNLTDPNLIPAVRARGSDWNPVLSIFVIQEIPDIAAFFRNLGDLLAPESFAILVTVHPDFAEWLREQGSLPVVTICPKPGRESWRWAGCYPIVDEPFEPFYLPHFQRTIDDYQNHMESAGLRLEQVFELPDAQVDIPRFRTEGFSPFGPFPTNVYWPRMAEKPSSCALIVRKGKG